MSVNPHKLRHLLARKADWRTRVGKKETKKCFPPWDVVNDVFSATHWDVAAIPYLSYITEIPVFDGDGRLIDSEGFDRKSNIYYSPGKDLKGSRVSPSPSEDEVAQAVGLFFNHLFIDFPFRDDGGASKAHALAAVLEPFVRPMIDGPMPMHLITAAGPGTGKGLLVDCISTVTTGRPAATSPTVTNDDEFRKTITAASSITPAMFTSTTPKGCSIHPPWRPV